jgi:SAM-dependent methyltransferase
MNIIKRIKRYLQIKFALKKDSAMRIISFWEKGGADFDYFEKADQDNWISLFWSSDSLFYNLFRQLDTRLILEIACGTGRHSAQISTPVEHLYLLDSSKGAIDLAKRRFADRDNVTFIWNRAGNGIPEIANESLTSVFSYDAMVHFEKETIYSYLADAYRVLQVGGLCLIHHSNYDKNPGGKFTDNKGWRNFMSHDLFCKYATEIGCKVRQSEIISFSFENSDCLSLLEKISSSQGLRISAIK